VRYGPPLLIVFSLVSRSYILDLRPGASFIEALVEAGFDVYMLDWGEPDERDADNRLEDYVDDYIPGAIDRILDLSGADEVNLFGYCFGGNLTLLYAAHHPDAPLRSLTVLATPVDFRHMGPLADVFRVGGMTVDSVLGSDGNVPPSFVVHVLEQRLARQFLATAHQPCKPGILDGHIVLRAALAAELKQNLAGRRKPRMTIAQRREAEAAVAARILGIADAQLRRIQ